MPNARDLFDNLRALDKTLYNAVAETRTPTLDVGMRYLSEAADHSKISLSVAGLLALRPGRTRRAAILGCAAVALASATANLVGKQVVRRPRPDRVAAQVATGRMVPMPQSASFPSGHTASAVAFAIAVSTALPAATVPLGALACMVGYSRVHTGVHYPGDVAAGALLGLASATLVNAFADHIRDPDRAAQSPGGDAAHFRVLSSPVATAESVV